MPPRGRPKGSLNKKPKPRNGAGENNGEIPIIQQGGMGEIDNNPTPRSDSDAVDEEQEEQKANESDEDDRETVIEGDMVFSDNDVYSEIFCNMVKLPQPKVIFTKKLVIAINLAMSKLCKKFLRSSSDLDIFNILTFPKLIFGPKNRKIMENIRCLGEGKGLDMLKERLRTFVEKPRNLDNGDQGIVDDGIMSKQEIFKAQTLTEQGKIRKAVMIVTKEVGIAPITPDNLEKIRELHPGGSEQPFGPSPGPEAPQLRDTESLQEIINTLDRQAAPGISGWTAQWVQMCYGQQGDDSREPFQKFMFQLAQMIVAGTAPGRNMLCAGRVTPLWKGLIVKMEVRSITVGESLLKVLSKLIIKITENEAHTLPVQFGSGNKGGVEPVCEKIQQCIDKCTAENPLYMHSIDIASAFPMMERAFLAGALRGRAKSLYRFAKWSYGQMTPLVVCGDGKIQILASQQGVRQGCPEAGKLFNIAMAPLIEMLIAEVLTDAADTTTMFYFDDGFVINNNPNLMEMLIAFFERHKPATGLALKVQKCKTVNLWDVKNGVVTFEKLGTTFGAVQFRRAFIVKKSEQLYATVEKLKQIKKQHGLILFKLSVSTKLRHLLRTMDWTGLDGELRRIDEIFYDYLDFMRALPEGELRDGIAERIFSLPNRYGGLGFLSMVEALPSAQKAAYELANHVLMERRLTTEDELAALSEQMVAEHRRNRYSQSGPMPGVAEEIRGQMLVKQGVLMEQRYKEEHIKLCNSLGQEQLLSFVDNKGGVKCLNTLPNGKYRSLTNTQVAALLNIYALRRKHPGPICPCGENNYLGHSDACGGVPDTAQMTHTSHNCIVSKTSEYLNKEKDTKATTETFVYENQPYNNNQQRADIKIEAQAGKFIKHTGLFDVMTKVVAAPHTDQARNAARTKAARDGIVDRVKIANLEIQAALKVGYDGKLYKYRHAIQIGIKLVPLIVSTGGTLHAIYKKFLKEALPNDDLRNGLMMDMSIYLARRRAQLYNANVLDVD